MSDQRITQLTALPKASVAATDVLPIADLSASQTKKVTAKDLVDAGLDLVDAGSIDLDKLDQSSTTKLGTTALADDAITAAKLADDSSVYVDSTAPSTNNFEGRGYLNSTTNKLQVYKAGSFTNVVPELVDGSVTTAKLADGAVTTAKASDLGTAALADDAVTYAKLQNTSTSNVLLGRSTAGAGNVEEVPCTAAGRALLDDADAAAQRATLGLGSLATQNGTFSGTHSGTTSGTNTGDQTITLTGDVTGSGTGSFAATVASNAITAGKIAADAVTTAKVINDAITGAKLADNSAAVVAAATPSGSGAFVGQQWINTNTATEYTWDGTAWLRQASLSTLTFTDSTPISFSVDYPDAYSATITTTLDTQAAARVLAGPATGADAAPTFRALVPGDLPDATVSTKGIVQPGTGLSISSGTLNHTNSATAGTYPKVTIDAQGHVTAGAALEATDIPVLDTSKITTGTFGTAFLTDDAVTAAKLANYSTAKFGEAIPVADFIGQIFFNPLAEAFFLWDGNVWQPLGISAGAVIFAGTYNATTNLIASVTTEGSAIGLTVGSALPSASDTNKGYYVVVSTGGTGTSPAPTVSLQPPDLVLSNGSTWNEIDVSSTYVSQTASNVAFSPAASIASTNVQAAVEEVSNECRNADNITSGTLAAARGGTGTGSYTKGDLLAASGATALSKLGVGTNGQVLRANSATATGLEWGLDYLGTVTSVSGSGAISVATGTTTPAISVASATTSVAGVVQLSDSTSTTSSVLAATPTAVKAAYDLAAAAMPRAGGQFTGDVTLHVGVGLVFEGVTDDVYETRLVVADPTSDHVITLPNTTGTIVTTGDTGTVTSTMLLDGTILNADVNASAAIAGTKISPDFGSQNVTTTGTSTAASFIPTSSTAPSNGVYLPAANSVAISTNGTQRVLVDSAGAVTIPNRIIIGAANNVGGLSETTRTTAGVFSTSRVLDGGTNPYIQTGAEAGIVYFNADGSSLPATAFRVGGSERMRLDASGRLGLGTSAPSYNLEVAAGQSNIGITSNTTTAGNEPSLVFTHAGNNAYVIKGGSNLSFASDFGANTRMTLTTGGRLGLGNNNPKSKLDVTLAGVANLATSTITSVSSFGANGSFGFAGLANNLDGVYFGMGAGGGNGIPAGIGFFRETSGWNTALAFYTNNLTGGPDSTNAIQEKMRITSAGFVGIGTTSPGTNLNVVASGAGGKGGEIIISNSSARQSGNYAQLGFAPNNDYGGIVICGFIRGLDTGGSAGNPAALTFGVGSGGSPTERMRLDDSGRLLVGTSSARQSSGGLQVESTAGNSFVTITRNDSGPNAPQLSLQKSRGTANGQFTVVNSNDQLGQINFKGADGTADITAAQILSEVDGTPGANDMPGRLVFSTTADGASSPTERVRIASTGRATFTNSSVGTPTALTDASTIAVDLAVANHFTVTLGGSRTLGAPTNVVAGQSGVIVITQDGTGSRTLAYNSIFKFPGGTAPTLTTTANAVDILVYYAESATRISARLVADVK